MRPKKSKKRKKLKTNPDGSLDIDTPNDKVRARYDDGTKGPYYKIHMSDDRHNRYAKRVRKKAKKTSKKAKRAKKNG